MGGQFPDPCWLSRVPEGGDPETGSTRYGRAVTAAADEAIADAIGRGWRPGERVALLYATTGADRELWRQRYLGPEPGSPRRWFVEQVWTTPAARVINRHQFHGPSMVVSAACASGLHAMALGQRLMATGDATDVVVVSADIGFDGEEIRAFANLNALVYDAPPQEVCRPFHENTRGFIMGEGAAALVMAPARQPGVEAHVRLLGSAMGNDAFHPVSIEPSFKHLISTMDTALGHAEVAREEIGFYSAHGTGTSQCDEADVTVAEYLGKQSVAYCFKPMLGHTMGTAPLLEAVITARAYSEGLLPASAAEPEAHPQLARGPMPHPGGITAQLGLGFGGNVTTAVYGSVD
ncbi:beta-ketoacyl synthase N-terminal-like domain-containing protein [Kitasatospora sp. NPDC051170]|uniref:beta-ketoacyl synthase N-terminal-like domain-containing protein n=1 Tax=Kitasatospora sp. NPDC051170 TaxID=3364056 RepID=UPI0037A5F9B0